MAWGEGFKKLKPLDGTTFCSYMESSSIVSIFSIGIVQVLQQHLHYPNAENAPARRNISTICELFSIRAQSRAV